MHRACSLGGVTVEERKQQQDWPREKVGCTMGPAKPANPGGSMEVGMASELTPAEVTVVGLCIPSCHWVQASLGGQEQRLAAGSNPRAWGVCSDFLGGLGCQHLPLFLW